MNKNWKIYSCREKQVLELSEQLHISTVTATLLINRGFEDEPAARDFLSDSEMLTSDPFLLRGIKTSVDRIQSALQTGEKIIIYGDYDVDGICSVVLLKDCFAQMGHNIDYYVPDRFTEGYGLNKEAIKRLAEKGCTLLITVDCGITSLQEVEFAGSLGMDVIITDHHTPPSIQPDAAAIVNPKNDNKSWTKDLAGVGVAYKLACALMQQMDPKTDSTQWLDLVALATVADIVPLIYENRILVQRGLKEIAKTRRVGLKALLEASGLVGQQIKSWHIGFVLGPRLNSAGRMKDAGMGIELLLSSDANQAKKMADQLCRMNEERKTVEDNLLKAAIQQIETCTCLQTDPVLVVGGEGWHEGVIGIVASRLADQYNRPVIIISWQGNEGRGSARSVGSFDMFRALESCSESLNGFGGHQMAAGLNLLKESFANFYSMIQLYAANNFPNFEGKVLALDMEIDEETLSMELWDEIQRMEPFGEGNPLPLFLLRSVEINETMRVGGHHEHLKCKVGKERKDAILFRCADLDESVFQHRKQDLAVELDLNEFRGTKKLQLKIKGLKASLPWTVGLTHQLPRIENMNQISHKVQDELLHHRPVLFVYPSFRSLNKHSPILKVCFPDHQIEGLHGQVLPWDRSRSEKSFGMGSPKVFISTRSYIDYYKKLFPIPENLHLIVTFWTSDAEDARTFQQQEMVFIGQKQQFSLLRTDLQEIPKGKRLFMYANRAGTCRQLSELYPSSLLEAGLQDDEMRKRIRKQFADIPQGVLISDGTSHGLQLGAQNIDFAYLMDCPFGKYELSCMSSGFDDGEPVQWGIAFQRESLAWDKRYLKRVYPDRSLIQSIWSYFVQLNKLLVRESIETLKTNIKRFTMQEISSIELLAILHILADLGLCRFQKRGSIIEIKFVASDNQRLDIHHSPYFLEGLAEQTLLNEWEEELEQCQIW